MAKRLKDEQIEKAIIKTNGKVGLMAQMLDTSRQSIRSHINANPKLSELMYRLPEIKLDAIENKLDEAALRGEPWAVCFKLKCLAKDRGYVERQEVTGAAGGAIKTQDVTETMTEEQIDAALARATASATATVPFAAQGGEVQAARTA
jgi:hypothetical protein